MWRGSNLSIICRIQSSFNISRMSSKSVPFWFSRSIQHQSVYHRCWTCTRLIVDILVNTRNACWKVLNLAMTLFPYWPGHVDHSLIPLFTRSVYNLDTSSGYTINNKKWFQLTLIFLYVKMSNWFKFFLKYSHFRNRWAKSSLYYRWQQSY